MTPRRCSTCSTSSSGQPRRSTLSAGPGRRTKAASCRFPTAADEVIRLAPLPFVHANRMLDGFEDPAPGRRCTQTGSTWSSRAWPRGLLDGFDNRRDVAIFAAHLYVGNAVLSGSERKIQVGENYATHLEHLPAVTYAAFGHIHKPQKLPGGVVNGCYAGSPIQLDFGELDEAKRIVLVEAARAIRRRSSPCRCPADGRCGASRGPWTNWPKAAPGVGRVLALLTIHSPSTIADLHARVQDLLPEAVVLDVYPVAADRQLGVAVATAPAGPEPGIEELFRGYLAEQGTRGAAADRVMATFSKLLEAIETEQEPVFPEEAAISGTTPADGQRPRARRARRCLAAGPALIRRAASALPPAARAVPRSTRPSAGDRWRCPAHRSIDPDA